MPISVNICSIKCSEFSAVEYQAGKRCKQRDCAQNEGEAGPGLVPGDPHGGESIECTQPLQRSEH